MNMAQQLGLCGRGSTRTQNQIARDQLKRAGVREIGALRILWP